MAKFKRFDPRNKKQNKHKHDSKYAFIERKLNGIKTVEKYKLGICCSVDVDEIYRVIKNLESINTLVTNNKNNNTILSNQTDIY